MSRKFTYAFEMDMKSHSDMMTRRAKQKKCPVHHHHQHVQGQDIKSTTTQSDRKSSTSAPVVPSVVQIPEIKQVSEEEKRASVSAVIKKMLADMLVDSLENFITDKKTVQPLQKPVVIEPVVDSTTTLKTNYTDNVSQFAPTSRNILNNKSRPEPPGTHPSLIS